MASYDDLLTNTENLEELMAPAEERVWPPVRRAPSRAKKSAAAPVAKTEEDPEFLPSLEEVLKLPKRENRSQPAKASAETEKSVTPRNPRRKAKKKYLNRNYLLLYLFAATAIPELLLHITTAIDGTLFNSGLILPLLFAAVPALIVYGVTLLVPNRSANFWITVGYSALVLLLCGSQKVYYEIFGTFYTAYSMANGGDAFQFVDTIINGILASIIPLLLMALPLIAMAVLGRKYFSFKPMKAWQAAVAPMVVAIVLQLLLVLCLPIFGGTDALSAYDMYHNSVDAYAGVNKLGLLTYFRVDVTRLITGFEGGGELILDDPVETDPPTDTTGVPGESTAPVLGDNVLDINFKSLINRTTNEDLQTLHNYFASRTPTNKNEKTGMFEGCNLIMICAEGFSSLAVTEERTPTLYKLMNEGFIFTNYYVPIWGVSTTDGEYSFLTGTVPKGGVWSFKRTALEGKENSMPLTMSRQLIAKGYNAYAYHGHTYDYYSRNLYLENLGYQYKGYGNGLDIPKRWPASDVEVMEASMSEYMDNQPFTTYYMTISGHLEYNFTGNAMAKKNKDLVADEPYSDPVKAYLATQLELEKSLAILMAELEAKGILENTVIVLNADHYPYGLKDEQISELLGHEVETNFELYKNQCVIYKAGMTPETIDEPCSTLDLLPTLSNLFGLDFDSRLYMGRDVFSDSEPFVMFNNRSWITDKCSYNAVTKEVVNFTDEEVSEDYIKKHKNDLNNRFKVSAMILDMDYWRSLFG